MFLTTHYSHYFEFLATLSFWFVVDNDMSKTSTRTKIGGIESMFFYASYLPHVPLSIDLDFAFVVFYVTETSHVS